MSKPWPILPSGSKEIGSDGEARPVSEDSFRNTSIVAVCHRVEWERSVWMCLQNMSLAAVAEGLGSGIVLYWERSRKRPERSWAFPGITKSPVLKIGVPGEEGHPRTETPMRPGVPISVGFTGTGTGAEGIRPHIALPCFPVIAADRQRRGARHKVQGTREDRQEEPAFEKDRFRGPLLHADYMKACPTTRATRDLRRTGRPRSTGSGISRYRPALCGFPLQQPPGYGETV